ncbi:hypothetical protein KHA80_06200 [Anaerobacillus sp. HL2]|nr:hypothetical protein KHA80_06200 [Anaerobacillus sp. HL2]
MINRYKPTALWDKVDNRHIRLGMGIGAIAHDPIDREVVASNPPSSRD